jgi:hypothetical protein
VYFPRTIVELGLFMMSELLPGCLAEFLLCTNRQWGETARMSANDKADLSRG